ncbi:MAG: hypothetical protein NVS4B5_14020 [Vulcanimicrobiaceae bacterium]
MGQSQDLYDEKFMTRKLRIDRIECEVSGVFDIETLRKAIAAELSRQAVVATAAGATGDAVPKSSLISVSRLIAAEIVTRSASRRP